VPCDKTISASAGAAQTISNSRLRQFRQTKKSATTFNPQVQEFCVANLEADLHWLTANLAIFNVRLSAGRQIENDTH
jgi:hypothetical protein